MVTGQFDAVQSRVSVGEPTQVAPPHPGAGLVQDRVLVCVPALPSSLGVVQIQELQEGSVQPPFLGLVPFLQSFTGCGPTQSCFGALQVPYVSGILTSQAVPLVGGQAGASSQVWPGPQASVPCRCCPAAQVERIHAPFWQIFPASHLVPFLVGAGRVHWVVFPQAFLPVVQVAVRVVLQGISVAGGSELHTGSMTAHEQLTEQVSGLQFPPEQE